MCHDLLPSSEAHPRPKLKIKLPTVSMVANPTVSAPVIEPVKMEVDEPPVNIEPIIDLQTRPIMIPSTPSVPVSISVPKPKSTKKVKLSEEQEKFKKAVKRLMNQKNSFWFHHPVDPVALNLTNYYDIVKEPMDLGTVLQKVENGEYDGVDNFIREVRLVFDNAKIFNPPGTQVYIDADLLKSKFEVEFCPEFAKPDPETVEQCLDIWNKLVASEHSAIFRTPVDGNLYPSYYKTIKEPMDLATMKEKIDNEKYANMPLFFADVRRIINNCFKFNKKGTYGFAAGRSFENYFNQIKKGEQPVIETHLGGYCENRN